MLAEHGVVRHEVPQRRDDLVRHGLHVVRVGALERRLREVLHAHGERRGPRRRDDVEDLDTPVRHEHCDDAALVAADVELLDCKGAEGKGARWTSPRPTPPPPPLTVRHRADAVDLVGAREGELVRFEVDLRVAEEEDADEGRGGLLQGDQGLDQPAVVDDERADEARVDCGQVVAHGCWCELERGATTQRAH